VNPWWREAVFYQIYPRSFMDANGDGVGDLTGIIERLDYLAGTPESLGVDAIWLSPFYRSPMADFGYDVADHSAVDPIFGSLADFDRLVSEAHRRGLRVIVDLIANHTSDRHQWFVDSRSAKQHPRRSWYVWRAANDGRPPNNWMSEFNGTGSAWTYDQHTGEWYLHSFLPEQPDLNWDEPQVEAAMHDVMRFWLARGVDGFRADVIHKIGKAPDLRDNLGEFIGPRAGDAGRRFDEDWPSVHPRIRRMRSLLRSFGSRMMVGEVYLLDPQRLASYVQTGRELDLAHNFHFLNLPWDAVAFRDAIQAFEGLVAPHGWPTWCLNNHDHSRVASRYPGDSAARVAAMLLLTLRGTPFLFQGEELGLQDGLLADDQIVDVGGRDPERCPIPWDPPSIRPGAGFTAGRPWLPFPPDAEEHNVAREAANQTSMLSLYRRLLRVRREHASLRSGSTDWLGARDRSVLAYRRSGLGGSFLVVLNFGERATAVSAAEAGGRIEGTIEVSSCMDRLGEPVGSGALELEPLEGLLIREP
jgi:alpha-glucosidase